MASSAPSGPRMNRANRILLDSASNVALHEAWGPLAFSTARA